MVGDEESGDEHVEPKGGGGGVSECTDCDEDERCRINAALELLLLPPPPPPLPPPKPLGRPDTTDPRVTPALQRPPGRTAA